MFNFNLSYKWLAFTRPTGIQQPVPEGLERIWVDSPLGRLELLTAVPTASKNDGPPVFFCHGGMGGAWVWAEYMRFLAAQGVRCYAISLRGHGDSWHPSYLRMVFATTRGMLCDDLVRGIEWVQNKEKNEVMLVGHSSGGGLSQAILSEGRVHVKGLALLGAVPCFGSMGVYINWAKLDPWFMIRMSFHGGHPNSPLSHPTLTQRAFFGDKFPPSLVIPFQQRISRYESLLWPFSMMLPFATASGVLHSIKSSNSSEKAISRMLIMSGTQDKLMTLKVMNDMAAMYRKEAGIEQVRTEQVEGAGHHLQNDVQWEDGAMKLLDFHKQL